MLKRYKLNRVKQKGEIMKEVILSLVAISSLAFASGDAVLVVPAAQEIDDTGFYLGAGVSAMSSRKSSVSMDIFNQKDGQDRLGNLEFLAGYMVNDYLAIEGRYGFGITDEDRVEMSSQWSIFLKPIYKFEDDEDRANGENYFSVYALFGYGGVKFDGVNGVVALVDQSGFQWGLGVSYTFRETSSDGNYTYKDSWTVYADYACLGTDMEGLYYTGETEVNADAFTVGIIYKF
ncbi:MAG: hypothetical protein DRG30_09305 [Epsilonproteobacteria bacterium]|nr:MAG: hypothetical protein DRG30_09305 [Campylobacterota bacterium]